MEKTIHSPAYQHLILWLKECREEKGLSMRELAEKLDVSHSWIGKVEQMERRLDICEYIHLCRGLGINPDKGMKILQANIK